MALHRLPAELIALILEAAGSPRDLFSLVSASAACFRVYNASPQRTVASVLGNFILPEALPHALAAIRAATIGPHLADNLEPFLDEYFQINSFNFPTDKDSIFALCRLCSRTSYFVAAYSTRAMRALGLEQDAELCLSPTERARFQRAFFRYELYSKLYPADRYNRRKSSRDVVVHQQFDQFLARIEPWEAEEMSCVHYYFASHMGDFIDDLEHEVVQSVLTAPGVFRPRPLSAEPPRHARFRTTRARVLHSLKSSRNDSDEELTDKNYYRDLRFFDCLDLTDLDMFSKEGRRRSPELISYLASLGSGFIYHLVLADENRRKHIILKHANLLGRPFLPEALGCAGVVGPKSILPNEVTDRDTSRPTLGWYSFKRPKYDIYLHINYGGIMNFPLRERAFVFWDADKITSRVVNDSLQRAKDMEWIEVKALYDRSARKSAEERLEGVRIPRAQMDRIEREFGSTFEYD